MPRVLIRPGAWREINEQLDYLEAQAGLETAERFLSQLRASADESAEMPRLGRLCGFRRPSLRRVRLWPVRGFANWLIFYLPVRDGIEILHVLHGARDIERLLDV